MQDDPFDPTREAAGAPTPESEREDRRADRKERVLHTRISEQLSDDIRRMAEDLRVPVSNLVRNVLEEAFGAVERVSEEVGDLLDDVLGEAEDIRDELRRRRRTRARRRGARAEPPAAPATPAPPAPPAEPGTTPTRAPSSGPGAGAHMTFPDVLGWQPLVVNGSRECACGERTLAPGDEAFVGVTERGLSGSLLCAACMRARGADRAGAAGGR